MIAIGGLGIIIALIITGITHKNESSDELSFDDPAEEPVEGKKSVITNNDICKVFFC
jgi:hypothetical protein